MKKLGILSSLFIILLFSCEKKASVEEMIQLEVESKMRNFRNDKIEACELHILEEVEIYVDSLLYLKMGNTINDSIILPNRPDRPDDSLGQGYEIKLDTLDSSIMFKDSSKYDSIDYGQLDTINK